MVWHQLMFHVIVLLIYGISENQNWCLVSILFICIFHLSFDNKQKILPVYIQFIVTNHKTISDTGMYPQLISNLLSKYFYTSMILFSVEVNIQRRHTTIGRFHAIVHQLHMVFQSILHAGDWKVVVSFLNLSNSSHKPIPLPSTRLNNCFPKLLVIVNMAEILLIWR